MITSLYDSTYSFRWSVTKTRLTLVFRKSLFGIQALGFTSPCIAHASARLDGIHSVHIQLIGIRDSPDHRSVRNKEVNFI